LVMMGFAALGAWAGVYSASLSRGLLFCLLALLLYGVALFQLDRLHWRLECLPPLAAGILALTLGWGRRAQIEKRDRAQLRDLFNRQVAPEVAEAIWRQRATFFIQGRVLPVEVRVTVLFADLRGFTSITEQLDRERMVLWLNAAVEQMTESVMEAGGVVTRFGGDQIMAVFGVPVPRATEAEQREDAACAVRAALRMRERLSELNARMSAEGLPAARVRVGLQSGTALQCGVGSRDRFEFTVLGDAVNTASRLESLPGEDDGSSARIFAGSNTIALCGHLFSHEHVAELKLKGKDIPVDVYRIKGEAA
jgi:adenylate cyclase